MDTPKGVIYYTIYKITNKINNKTYIGKHQTKNLNDNYMGSGKLIKAAIKKYGIENFIKEILFIFDNETDMNNKEKELVVLSENSYNLCEGGKGGFGYINSDIWTEGKRQRHNNKISGFKKFTKEQRKEYGILGGKSKNELEFGNRIKKLYPNGTRFKSTVSEETKNKISSSKKGKCCGKSNPMYGKVWITNGQENKTIKKEELDKWIELGYSRGKLISPYRLRGVEDATISR